MRDNLEKGMRLEILDCSLEPTTFAEADVQQAFVDILDVDIIKPLAAFKVNEKDPIGTYLSDNMQPER